MKRKIKKTEESWNVQDVLEMLGFAVILLAGYWGLVSIILLVELR